MGNYISEWWNNNFTNNIDRLEPIAGSIDHYDSDRWSIEKQHELFDAIKAKNINIYEELMDNARYMNGHSLDMISIAMYSPWKDIIKNPYFLKSILTEKCLLELFSKDADYKQWVINKKS